MYAHSAGCPHLQLNEDPRIRCRTLQSGHKGALAEHGSPPVLLPIFRSHRHQRSSVRPLLSPRCCQTTPGKINKNPIISRRSHTRFLMTTVGVYGWLRVSAADQSVGAGCHGLRKVHYRGRISWERERGTRYRRNRRGGWVDKRDGRVLFVGCVGSWRGG